jgi:aminoglycoside 3-N-acetyltransferase
LEDRFARQSSLHQVAAKATRLITTTILIDDLRALGISVGDVVLVHSSLSRLGWVIGDQMAVVDALMAAVGPTGTLVMPTHSATWTDPAAWSNPPMPSAWIEIARAEMPAFDPARTPTVAMGAIVECFRTTPGVRRSSHPTASFAALGPQASLIVDDHQLEDDMGEQSPLGRLYELDAKVLLLGVGHENNSSLHLSEHRASYVHKSFCSDGSSMLTNGVKQWIEYRHLDENSDDFASIGLAFAATDRQRIGRVGEADAILMQQRDVVDFGVAWMNEHR